MKPWRWTGGTAAAWAVALLGACASDGRPALDLGGLRLDGGFPFPPVDAGLEAGLGPVRGNEPALPSADLRFELPFGGPAVETPREIAARAGRLDVALSIDTTGSFDEEIAQLRAPVPCMREDDGGDSKPILQVLWGMAVRTMSCLPGRPPGKSTMTLQSRICYR
ncbi:MAG: hypothetical protein AAF447_28075 [Myxococcota bacterium]